MRFALGVDGGGTKTLALVADPSGRVLGTGRAGSCDIYSNPRAADEVERAVRAALAQAGLLPESLAHATYSLAGADWPEDFAFWQGELAARGLGRRIEVVNDAVGALCSGGGEEDAVIVVCGTGSATGARNARTGAVWHSSFWQLTQGGGELSERALQAIWRADLGIDPPTSLAEPVLRHLDAETPGELLHRFTRRENRIAGTPSDLVPILFAQAQAGDGAARSILVHHGRELAEHAAVAARKVGIIERPFALLLAGGVFRAALPLFRESLLARLAELSAHALPKEHRFEPLRGAALMALRGIGAAGEGVRAELDRTFPAPEFFHTG